MLSLSIPSGCLVGLLRKLGAGDTQQPVHTGPCGTVRASVSLELLHSLAVFWLL